MWAKLIILPFLAIIANADHFTTDTFTVCHSPIYNDYIYAKTSFGCPRDYVVARTIPLPLQVALPQSDGQISQVAYTTSCVNDTECGLGNVCSNHVCRPVFNAFDKPIDGCGYKHWCCSIVGCGYRSPMSLCVSCPLVLPFSGLCTANHDETCRWYAEHSGVYRAVSTPTDNC